MRKFVPLLISFYLLMGVLHNAMGCAATLIAGNYIGSTNTKITRTILGNNDTETIVNKETLPPTYCDLEDAEQEILNFYSEKRGYRVSHYRVSPVDKKIEKDYAYNYGYYEIAGTAKGQITNNTQKMAYLILWKRISAQKWKMYLDIWDYQAPNQQDVYFF